MKTEETAAWVIEGRSKDSLPEVGKTYEVRHSRKGTFVMTVTALDGIWLTGTIVDGISKALLDYNVRETGEEIAVRNSLCYLIPR